MTCLHFSLYLSFVLLCFALFSQSGSVCRTVSRVPDQSGITYLLMHGWEIAVILRNFRKTKLSKSKFFFFFFFFNSISTYIQCAT